jgi:hypothetical protein
MFQSKPITMWMFDLSPPPFAMTAHYKCKQIRRYLARKTSQIVRGEFLQCAVTAQASAELHIRLEVPSRKYLNISGTAHCSEAVSVQVYPSNGSNIY